MFTLTMLVVRFGDGLSTSGILLFVIIIQQTFLFIGQPVSSLFKHQHRMCISYVASNLIIFLQHLLSLSHAVG